MQTYWGERWVRRSRGRWEWIARQPLIESRRMEERVVKTREGPKIVKVAAHSGVVGNDLADYRVKEGVAVGIERGLKERATPAGTKPAFKVGWRSQ